MSDVEPAKDERALTSVLLPEDLSEVEGELDAILPRSCLEGEGGHALGHGRQLEEVASDDELFEEMDQRGRALERVRSSPGCRRRDDRSRPSF